METAPLQSPSKQCSCEHELQRLKHTSGLNLIKIKNRIKKALPLSNCPVLPSFHFHYVVEVFEHLFSFYGNLWNELSLW